MNTLKDIIIVCCALWVILFIPVLVFTLIMGKAAAPKNNLEHMIDDYQQMKALNYFKSAEEQINALDYIFETITSGSPVTHK